MTVLPIKIYPDPILSQRGRLLKLEEIKSPKIKKLIANMRETMKLYKGVGLAAPQVGESISLCVINFQGEEHVLINPKISSKSWRKRIFDEGCLSFPGKFIPVKRSESVKVKALNEQGEKIKLSGEGFLSETLQHEIDHLHGILFISYEVKKKKTKNGK